jgi:hypothetical protein
MHVIGGYSYRRRGATLVFTAATLFVMFGFVALAVDGGYLYNIRNDVQSATDAGALSGATVLFTDEEEYVDAVVQRFTSMNFAAAAPVLAAERQIQVGRWSYLDRTFTPVRIGDEYANAVRVIGSRHHAPALFAALLGYEEFNVDRLAIAHKTPPCRGIWGLDRVTVSGDAVTDSYDSAESWYSPLTSGVHGDVCSNGPIEVIGSAEVFGDAGAGPGYEVEERGNAVVHGASTPGNSVKRFEPVDMGDVATVNDNASIGLTTTGRDPIRDRAAGWDLRLGSGADSLTLGPGTYYFTSISIGSQATLITTGDVTIYVSGDVRMAGGAIVNTTQDPHSLTIYSTGSTFELYGGTGFHGTLYAPNTDVYLIGSSAYYGEIVGKTVDIGGTATIHVDESLDLHERGASPPFLVQ